MINVNIIIDHEREEYKWLNILKILFCLKQIKNM